MAGTGRRLRRIDLLAAIAAVVLVIGAVQLIAGALTVGITTDEPVHVDWANRWLDDGWYGQDERVWVYGPAYDALVHGINVVRGNESLDRFSSSAAAFDVRHLIAAALGLLAAVAVGGTVRRLSGSRRFSLWAAAGLLAVPAWTGHAFFNHKDIPAACGYTLITAALILALVERADRPSTPRCRWVIGAMLAGGIFIGVGTRLALWVPFVASLATYAVLRLGQHRLGGIEPRARADVSVAAGALAGFAGIAILYPNAAGRPLSLLSESVSGSSGFGWTGNTLTAGQLLSEHPPWWYLPAWFGASLPLLLGGLAVLGAVLGIYFLVRGPGPAAAAWRRPELGLVLVFQQAFMLPLAAMVTGATMYDGVRQHLYVLPAIAVLSGVGAWRLWSWASERRLQNRWRALAVSLLGAALLVPMVEQTLLFPYNYGYISPVAGIGGVNDRWEADYWFASAPEALSRTPSTSKLLCSEVLVIPGAARPELRSCLDDRFEPFMERRGDSVDERWRDDSSAVWLVGVKRGGNRPPDYCKEVDQVTRWLRGEDIILSYVLRCDPEETQRDLLR